MTINAPELARILQTITPAVVALDGYLTVASVYAEAQTYPGPPFYLPFVFLVVLLSATFCIAALFLWLWRPFGWCFSILLDAVLALGLGYIMISVFFREGFKFMHDPAGNLLAITETAWFSFLAVLSAKRQSLKFFGIWDSAAPEPA